MTLVTIQGDDDGVAERMAAPTQVRFLTPRRFVKLGQPKPEAIGPFNAFGRGGESTSRSDTDGNRFPQREKQEALSPYGITHLFFPGVSKALVAF